MRAVIIVLCVVLSGCVGGPGMGPPEESPRVASPPPMSMEHNGTFVAYAGTPGVGPAPFTQAGQGDVAFVAAIRAGTRTIVIDVDRASATPVRLELHAQPPEGATSTATLPVGSTDQKLHLEIAGDDLSGDWVIGVSPEGAASQVAWHARVTADP